MPTREASGKPILQPQRGQFLPAQPDGSVRPRAKWELTAEEKAKLVARERLEDAADAFLRQKGAGDLVVKSLRGPAEAWRKKGRR